MRTTTPIQQRLTMTLTTEADVQCAGAPKEMHFFEQWEQMSCPSESCWRELTLENELLGWANLNNSEHPWQ